MALALLCAGGGAFAQNESAAGLAAEATYKWDLPRGWAVSVGPGLEWRPYHDASDAGAGAPPVLRNLDLNAAVMRRWLERWRFGSAVRVRARYAFSDEAARELRFWSFAERISDAGYVRWHHRLRTEQRLRGDVGHPLVVSYRHRYRVGFERALAGRAVDAGEWFVTGTVELLLASEALLAHRRSVDIRPAVAVGRNDLEFGLEYRHERGITERDRDTGRVLLATLQWAW